MQQRRRRRGGGRGGSGTASCHGLCFHSNLIDREKKTGEVGVWGEKSVVLRGGGGIGGMDVIRWGDKSH